MRGLGAVYAAAFVSLWVQIDGLLGSGGIRPVAQLLPRAAERLGAAAALRVPTLLWIDASDAALHVLCAAGMALAALALVGALPRVALFGCWLAYLSLVAVGDVFLSYQWDALLLEAGLLAVLYAPPGAWLGRSRRASEASTVGLLLLRFLVFRLFVLSGWVKLLSGDPTWRDLSALEYHWWSQPLPIRTSLLAAALPDIVQRAECALSLVVECAVPLAILAGRRGRLLAAATFVLLQFGIAATGNYGFFNALTVVLCVTLLDDAALAPLARRLRLRAAPEPGSAAAEASPPGAAAPRAARRAVALALGGLLAACAALQAAERLGARWAGEGAFGAALSFLAPFRSVNSYGLFAVMTTRREEIEIEGSDDGAAWRTYEFRWKPGRTDRAPRLAPLHMPRLDWQMWFAALGRCEDQGWLHAFLARLLEGSPGVLRLLEANPFPERPPRYVRARFFDYRFASGEERRQGLYWTRRPVGLYCPDLTLEHGKLALAPGLEPPAE